MHRAQTTHLTSSQQRAVGPAHVRTSNLGVLGLKIGDWVEHVYMWIDMRVMNYMYICFLVDWHTNSFTREYKCIDGQREKER